MPQPSATHVPPQNIEAEESVLGAMLVAEPALSRVIDEVKLNAEDFYLEKHGLIFACARDLYSASKPVDELSVTEALAQRNKIDGAGGKHYVSELAAKVPAAGNAKHYAEIVQQNSLLRRQAAQGPGRTEGLAEGGAGLQRAGGGAALVRRLLRPRPARPAGKGPTPTRPDPGSGRARPGHRRLPAADARRRSARQPGRAGRPDESRAEDPRPRAGGAGAGDLAALPRPGAAQPTEADALGPEGVRVDRAGRGRRRLSLPRGLLPRPRRRAGRPR